jgi:translocator protein
MYCITAICWWLIRLSYIIKYNYLDVTLNKPSLNPPNYIFAPVWTILYTLMGISLYIVLKKAKEADKFKLVGIFILQLILNFFWSIIFFKLHHLGIALIEILMMWASIVAMLILFYKTSKLASLMNIPYLLWVSFATILNYSICILN